MVAEIHHRHRDVSGGWLRPAVFGVMDGLVSNISLISGLAGGGGARHTVALAGLAGLMAGATSMAIGEYTSVRSQAEALGAELAVERAELHHSPAAEARELATILSGRGVDADLAAEVARQISRDPDAALRMHAREELGVDPDRPPSPVLAAGSSFLAFALGAAVPVLPFLLGASAFWLAALISGVVMFAVGALVSVVTTRSPVYSGLRQLMLGAAAAAATYAVGRLAGHALG
jgi:VIT1/CCC1 family predicted Fe2+/Mn2+ transporter